VNEALYHVHTSRSGATRHVVLFSPQHATATAILRAAAPAVNAPLNVAEILTVLLLCVDCGAWLAKVGLLGF